MTQIVAHRGLHVVEVENTVAAFGEARSLGCDGVELDVRRTIDDALVVHHDAEIVGVGHIALTSCRDLPVGVATLTEALHACTGMIVNVEIKNDPNEAGYDPSGALARQVVDALSELGWLDDVVISSFDLETCDAVRRSSSIVQVGWLLGFRSDPRLALNECVSRSLNAIHPFFFHVDDKLIAAAHDAGVAVNVWTVNEKPDMQRMIDLDVDMLITDDPATALSLVRS